MTVDELHNHMSQILDKLQFAVEASLEAVARKKVSTLEAGSIIDSAFEIALEEMTSVEFGD